MQSYHHPAAVPTEMLLVDCEVARTRGSGPGGQHRNKVETAIVIEHLPTGIRGAASERRSQAENRKKALFRLRVNLALGVRTMRDADDRPSALWASRCHGGRIAVSDEHDDFPALLAEALDVLEGTEMEIKEAAVRLGCSPSQLVRFFQLEPRAMAAINEHRRAKNLRPLK
jgi:hypothetical protein